MGYSTFKASPKSLTQGEDIGPGQIKLEHLDPALFAELKNVALHAHTGSGSRRISYQNLTGYVPPSGFYMYGDAGTKRYKVQIDEDTDTFVITEVT